MCFFLRNLYFGTESKGVVISFLCDGARDLLLLRLLLIFISETMTAGSGYKAHSAMDGIPQWCSTIGY